MPMTLGLLSLGLTRQQVVAGFSPLSLFAGSEAGAWYEPSPDNCFQDASATTPAGVGDPVGYLADLSGNGHHISQATAAARPALRQTGGGLYYLEFDGVDDNLEGTGFSLTTDTDCFLAIDIDETNTANQMFAASTGASVAYFGWYESGAANTSVFQDVGTPSAFFNGVSVSLANRGTLFDGISSGVGVVEFTDLDLATNTDWSQIRFMRYKTSAAPCDLHWYGGVLRQNMTADQKSSLRQYLADLCGASL